MKIADTLLVQSVPTGDYIGDLALTTDTNGNIKSLPLGFSFTSPITVPVLTTSTVTINWLNYFQTGINISLGGNTNTTIDQINAKGNAIYTIILRATSGLANIIFATFYRDKSGVLMQPINGLSGNVALTFKVNPAATFAALTSITPYHNEQLLTTHSNVTILDYVKNFYYRDVAVQLVGYTITLPLNFSNEDTLTIYFGNDANGVFGSGQVIIAPNTGQTIVNANLTGSLNANRQNGETITFKFRNNIWRIISRYVPS
jgi:hypothetical protein